MCNRIELLIVKLDYFFKNLIISLCRKFLFLSTVDPFSVHRILIFRNGSMGDTICALPAIFSIHDNFRESSIDILSNAGGSERISISNVINNPYIRKSIDYRELSGYRLLKLLRREKYDLIVELPQADAPFLSQLRNMFFFRLVGIPRGFGWKISVTYLFPKVQETLIHFDREPIRLLKILREYGLKCSERYEWNFTKEEFNTVGSVISEYKLDGTKCFIVLSIGGKYHRNWWPLERYSSVAQFVASKGYLPVVVGGKDDISRAQVIAGHAGAVNLCGELSVRETALLMKHAVLVISNDTGTLHMAYSVGANVIGLYSAREYPNKWFPPLESGNVALRQSQLPCSICVAKPCEDNICIKQISVKDVIFRIRVLLGDV